MDSKFKLSSFMLIAIIQILTFIFLFTQLINNFTSTIYPIILLALEIFVFLPILFGKNKKFFYLGWQLQFFLFLLFLTLFKFNETYQVAEAQTITILIFVGFLILGEILIFSYIYFKEKAIKSILFICASSTTIAVFLIVGFVMTEGVPALQENDPIQFLLGDKWQPFYEMESSESLVINTTIEPYNFSVSGDKRIVYLLPNSSRPIQFVITNTGGKKDSYLITVQHSPAIEVIFSRASVALNPQEETILNFSATAVKEGNYFIDINAISLSSQLERWLNLSLVFSNQGIDLLPDKQSALAIKTEAGRVSVPLKIKNIGLSNESFTIIIQSSDNFRPSIQGNGVKWNYTASLGSIELEAGETRNITLYPRMVTKILGTHEVLISAISDRHPDVYHESTLFYTYKEKDFLRANNVSKKITQNTTATYDLQIIKAGYRSLEVKILGEKYGWNISLKDDSIALLEGDGSINVSGQNQSIVNLTLLVTSTDKVLDQTLSVTVIVTKEGITPQFGILPFIVGTIVTTLIAVLIATPLGLGCAIFLAEFCPQRLRYLLRPLYELLAGIPSVLYGLWGFLTFGPWMADHIYPVISGSLGEHIAIFAESSHMGKGILTASIVLSFMILPIILTLSEDAIRSVRQSLKEGSLAMGATRLQTIAKIVLPEAKTGIISSIILGTGRAIGETMAILMIMQYASTIPTSVFDNSGTMTSSIAALLGSTFSFTLTRHALFAIGMILFFMIFSLNVIIYLIQRKTGKSHIKKNEKFSRKKTAFRFFDFSAILFPHVSIADTKEKKNQRKPQLTRQRKAIKISNWEGIKRIILRSCSKKKTRFFDDKATSGRQHNPIPSPFSVRSFIQTKKSHARRNQRIIMAFLIVAGIIVTVFLLFIIQEIVVKGLLSIKPEFLLEREIGVGAEGGFLNAIVGSLQLVGIAIGVASPLSIGSAIYVQEYAKKNNIFTKIILFTSDTLASTPSIVFGAFGFTFFVWYLHFGFSLIAGGLTLAIMIIPIMLRSSIESIKRIPNEYKDGSLALGATKWQTIQYVILPPALPGIASGVIISIGRAIGETAAIIFTAGYATHVTTSVLHPAASIPNLIYKNYELSSKYPILGEKVYSAAFILIVLVLILNSIARIVSYRSSKLMKRTQM